MLRYNLRNRVTALLGQTEILDEHLSRLPEHGKVTRLQTVLEGLQREIQTASVASTPEPGVQQNLAEAEQLASDLSEFSKADACTISQTIRRVTDRLYEVTEKVDRFLVVADAHTYHDMTAGTALRPTLESVREEVAQTYPDATISIRMASTPPFWPRPTSSEPAYSHWPRTPSSTTTSPGRPWTSGLVNGTAVESR